MAQELKTPTYTELERVYRQLNEIVEAIREHQWGKQVNNKDARFIADIAGGLGHVANELYLTYHQGG